MNPPKDCPGLLPPSILITGAHDSHDNSSCSCSPSATSRRTETKVKQSDRGNSTNTPKAPCGFTSGLQRSGQHSSYCISEQGFRPKYNVFLAPLTPVAMLISWFSTNDCVVTEKKVILIPYSVGAAGTQWRK